MNRDAWLTALVALSCIAAVGMSATTLETTLSEDPDDVVDLDYEHLPLGKDDAGEVKQEVESNQGQGSGTSSTSDSQGDPQPSGGSDDGEQRGGGSDGLQSGGSGGDGGGQGMGVGLVESLWDLLASLLPLLIAVVALALAYRYRDRLYAFGLALWASRPGRPATTARPPAEEWPGAVPDDEVHRAWLAMVGRLDLSRPQARTPLECARAAVDEGMDPDAVETLTTVFQEVRYGDRSVTDDHRDRAREGLRRLEGRPP